MKRILLYEGTFLSFIIIPFTMKFKFIYVEYMVLLFSVILNTIAVSKIYINLDVIGEDLYSY